MSLGLESVFDFKLVLIEGEGEDVAIESDFVLLLSRGEEEDDGASEALLLNSSWLSSVASGPSREIELLGEESISSPVYHDDFGSASQACLLVCRAEQRQRLQRFMRLLVRL